ncbi:MAG: MoxR family ATPase, partial [Acidiferrobacteraceae bacterium]
RISLGYTDRGAERILLLGDDRRLLLKAQAPLASSGKVLALRALASKVHASGALLDYVQDLLAATRSAPALAGGASPRAGLGLLAAARAYALLSGRAHVLPEDVQAVAVAVLAHRIDVIDAEREVLHLLETVAVP